MKHNDIQKEIRDSIKLEAESLRLLLKKLEPVRRSLAETVSREQAKREQRIAQISEYKSERDIQDAYGWDLITDEERLELLEQLETGKDFIENTSTKTSIALKTLHGYILDLTKKANALEFELLPENEQDKRREEIEKSHERVRARRAAAAER